MLDDWHSSAADPTGFGGGEAITAGNSIDGDSRNEYSARGQHRSSEQLPGLINVELVNQRDVRYQFGTVECATAGDGEVVLGTSQGKLLRGGSALAGSKMELLYDFGAGIAHSAYLEPFYGQHLFVGYRIGGQNELVYFQKGGDGRLGKPRKPKMGSTGAGTSVSTVAWNPMYEEAFRNSEHMLPAATPVSAFFGTYNGAILEWKDGGNARKLFQLTHPERICGIHVKSEREGHSRLFTMIVTTPQRFYTFTGKGLNVDCVFAGISPESLLDFTELPGEFSGPTKLQVDGGDKYNSGLKFYWMAAAGVYHGFLKLTSQSIESSHNLLLYDPSRVSSNLSQQGDQRQPIDIIPTEYHLIVVYQDYIEVMNKISEKAVASASIADLYYDWDDEDSITACCGDVVSNEWFIATKEGVMLSISLSDEDRDMWKIYLKAKDYTSAKRAAKTEEAREEISAAEADEAMSNENYTAAAKAFAGAPTAAPFEAVSLGFFSAVAGKRQQAIAGLTTYLKERLEKLHRNERSQATMLSTVILTLDLDSLTNADKSEVGKHVQKVKKFLSDYVDSLDERTTVKLLASHGMIQELIEFALAKDEFETAAIHQVGLGDVAATLSTLRDPRAPRDLAAKISTPLFELAPKEAVDFWIGSAIDPRSILPTLLRFSQPEETQSLPLKQENSEDFARKRDQVTRYLEATLFGIGNDRRTHEALVGDLESLVVFNDLLAAIYARSDGNDEAKLLRYLGLATPKSESKSENVLDRLIEGRSVCLVYNSGFLLRVFLEEGRFRGCVEVYMKLEMFEEAVDLAVRLDVETAIKCCKRAQISGADDERVKRLYLTAARKVLQTAGQDGLEPRAAFNKVLDTVQDAEGLVKIEDVLPLFPDVVVIDDLKEAIVNSVEEYNRCIESLKKEMDKHTEQATRIRRDLSALSKRSVLLEEEAKCARCGFAIMDTSRNPFFVFPCKTAFHLQCLLEEVYPLIGENQQKRLAGLLYQSSYIVDYKKMGVGSLMSPEALANTNFEYSTLSIQEVEKQIDDIIAIENPLFGERSLKRLSLSFISPSEGAEHESWTL